MGIPCSICGIVGSFPLEPNDLYQRGLSLLLLRRSAVALSRLPLRERRRREELIAACNGCEDNSGKGSVVFRC